MTHLLTAHTNASLESRLGMLVRSAQSRCKLKKQVRLLNASPCHPFCHGYPCIRDLFDLYVREVCECQGGSHLCRYVFPFGIAGLETLNDLLVSYRMWVLLPCPHDLASFLFLYPVCFLQTMQHHLLPLLASVPLSPCPFSSCFSFPAL